MGPSMARVACELVGQAQCRRPAQRHPDREPGQLQRLPVVRTDQPLQPPQTRPVDRPGLEPDRPSAPLTRALVDADAYVLAAPPETASLAGLRPDRHGRARRSHAAGTCPPPCTRPPSWSRSPRAPSRAPAASRPARWPAPATSGRSSPTRWQEEPLHDAYAFLRRRRHRRAGHPARAPRRGGHPHRHRPVPPPGRRHQGRRRVRASGTRSAAASSCCARARRSSTSA